ncbi:MAG: hypothetical protein ISR44_10010 [Rhodospirillales bacterium]|nr:hypothetical protein [Rhodospirillales bacterium]
MALFLFPTQGLALDERAADVLKIFNEGYMVERAVDLARELDDEDAEELLRAVSVDLDKRWIESFVDNPGSSTGITMPLIEAQSRLGDDDGMHVTLERIEAMLERSAKPEEHSFAYASLAGMWTRLGRPVRVRDLLSKMLEIAPKVPRRIVEVRNPYLGVFFSVASIQAENGWHDEAQATLNAISPRNRKERWEIARYFGVLKKVREMVGPQKPSQEENIAEVLNTFDEGVMALRAAALSRKLGDPDAVSLLRAASGDLEKRWMKNPIPHPGLSTAAATNLAKAQADLRDGHGTNLTLERIKTMLERSATPKDRCIANSFLAQMWIKLGQSEKIQPLLNEALTFPRQAENPCLDAFFGVAVLQVRKGRHDDAQATMNAIAPANEAERKKIAGFLLRLRRFGAHTLDVRSQEVLIIDSYGHMVNKATELRHKLDELEAVSLLRAVSGELEKRWTKSPDNNPVQLVGSATEVVVAQSELGDDDGMNLTLGRIEAMLERTASIEDRCSANFRLAGMWMILDQPEKIRTLMSDTLSLAQSLPRQIGEYRLPYLDIVFRAAGFLAQNGWYDDADAAVRAVGPTDDDERWHVRHSISLLNAWMKLRK